MTQFALPLDEPSKRPTPHGAAEGRDARGGSGDDVRSSEESKVEVMTPLGGAGRQAPPVATNLEGRGSLRRALTIGAWPAALTWSDALDYSSFSPAQLRRWEKAGALRFRRVGRNGAKVVMRSQLDQLLEQAFAPVSIDIAEDFDFG